MRILSLLFIFLFTSFCFVSQAHDDMVLICPQRKNKAVFVDFGEALEHNKERNLPMIIVFLSFSHNAVLGDFLLNQEDLEQVGLTDLSTFVVLQPNCCCQHDLPEHVASFKQTLVNLARGRTDLLTHTAFLDLCSEKRDAVFMVTFEVRDQSEVTLCDITKLHV